MKLVAGILAVVYTATCVFALDAAVEQAALLTNVSTGHSISTVLAAR